MEPLPVLIVFLVGLAFWATTSARRVDDGQVEAVARMYSVPLSPPVIERLRRRLLLVRRWRLVGALAGTGLGALAAATTSIDVSINVLLFSIACGFAVAATGFELVDARRSHPARRSVATAHPRTVRDVVPVAAVAPCAATVVLVGLSLVVSAIWVPNWADPSRGIDPLDPLLLGGLAALYVAVVAMAIVAARSIVMAGERGIDSADLVVRRATRLSVVMTVVGATWMSVGAIGVVIIQPLFNVQISAGGLSLLRFVLCMYVALSPILGFLATVTTVPRGGGRRPSGHGPGQLARPAGEAL